MMHMSALHSILGNNSEIISEKNLNFHNIFNHKKMYVILNKIILFVGDI